MAFTVTVHQVELKLEEHLEQAVVSAMLTCISIGTYKPDLVRHLADNLDRLVPDLLDGTRQAFDMLEFRGDRVLWIVSTMLIQDEYGHLFADDPRLFAVVAQSLTSNRVFNCILKSLHLWSSATGPKGAADMLEAIVGRIDRVLGFDKVKEVIKELLQPLISAGVEAGVHFLHCTRAAAPETPTVLRVLKHHLPKERRPADLIRHLRLFKESQARKSLTRGSSSQCHVRKDPDVEARTMPHSRRDDRYDERARHRSFVRRRSRSSSRSISPARGRGNVPPSYERRHSRHHRRPSRTPERSRSSERSGQWGPVEEPQGSSSARCYSDGGSTRSRQHRHWSVSRSPRRGSTRSRDDRSVEGTYGRRERRDSAGSDSDNDRDPKVHDQSSSPSPASLLPVIISAVARKYAQLPAYIRIPASFDRKPDMDNVDGLDKRRGKEIMADGIAVGLESGAWTQQQLTACASATLHDALTSVPVQEALADAIGMGTWAGKHEIRVMLGRASHHESIDYMRQIVMRLFNPVMQEALRLVAPLISIYPRNNLDPRRQHIYDAVLLYRAGRPFGTGLTHVQSIWSTNDSTMDALHTYDRLQAIRLI